MIIANAPIKALIRRLTAQAAKTASMQSNLIANTGKGRADSWRSAAALWPDLKLD